MPVYFGNSNKMLHIYKGSQEIDQIYKGNVLVYDRKPVKPVNPTYTTLATCGAGQTIVATVTQKGWYCFVCINRYEDSRRWGYAEVKYKGTDVWQRVAYWNDYQYESRTALMYLQPEDQIRMVEWGNSWTMSIQFQIAS